MPLCKSILYKAREWDHMELGLEIGVCSPEVLDTPVLCCPETPPTGRANFVFRKVRQKYSHGRAACEHWNSVHGLLFPFLPSTFSPLPSLFWSSSCPHSSLSFLSSSPSLLYSFFPPFLPHLQHLLAPGSALDVSGTPEQGDMVLLLEVTCWWKQTCHSLKATQGDSCSEGGLCEVPWEHRSTPAPCYFLPDWQVLFQVALGTYRLP